MARASPKWSQAAEARFTEQLQAERLAHNQMLAHDSVYTREEKLLYQTAVRAEEAEE